MGMMREPRTREALCVGPSRPGQAHTHLVLWRPDGLPRCLAAGQSPAHLSSGKKACSGLCALPRVHAPVPPHLSKSVEPTNECHVISRTCLLKATPAGSLPCWGPPRAPAVEEATAASPAFLLLSVRLSPGVSKLISSSQLFRGNLPLLT